MSDKDGRMTLIALRDVSKIYSMGHVTVNALGPVSLSIGRGEFLAVLGPSGSGKSTMMNILGCLDRPSTGTYLFAGHDVSRLQPDDLALLRSAMSHVVSDKRGTGRRCRIPDFSRLAKSTRHMTGKALCIELLPFALQGAVS